MLDVHPPHAPTHTWKDFLIHVGTICVGLLIAVALEQTVEAVHRATERRELLHDLHAECETNIETLGPDIALYREEVDWGTRAIVALRPAPVVQGTITVTLPPSLALLGTIKAPSRAVWAVAKSSGKVALLQESLAEVFDRVDREAEQTLLAADRSNDTQTALANFQMKTGTTLAPGATLHLTPAQRDELLTTWAASLGEERAAISWARAWESASQAVLHGVTDRRGMDEYFVTARAADRPH